MSKPIPPNPDTQSFFDVFAMSVGLPDESREALVKGLFFPSSDNTLWRLITVSEQENRSVRPELLLPMSVLEMQGQEVLRMLALQTYLFAEMNWWLSATDKGFLQLTSVAWTNQPSETVAMLDVARLIAPQIMQYIVHGEIK
jgi:hypothetical protein